VLVPALPQKAWRLMFGGIGERTGKLKRGKGTTRLRNDEAPGFTLCEQEHERREGALGLASPALSR
jgi:hypothetical protein